MTKHTRSLTDGAGCHTLTADDYRLESKARELELLEEDYIINSFKIPIQSSTSAWMASQADCACKLTAHGSRVHVADRSL